MLSLATHPLLPGISGGSRRLDGLGASGSRGQNVASGT